MSIPAIAGEQTFQGVDFNNAGDISRIYIRDHELFLDDSDGIGFVYTTGVSATCHGIDPVAECDQRGRGGGWIGGLYHQHDARRPAGGL